MTSSGRWPVPNVEMPVLHEAQARNPAVNFVFINQGESAERVGGWLKSWSPSIEFNRMTWWGLVSFLKG